MGSPPPPPSPVPQGCVTVIAADGVTAYKCCDGLSGATCKRLTIDPWGHLPAPHPGDPSIGTLVLADGTSLAAPEGQTLTTKEAMYKHTDACPGDCACRQIPPRISTTHPDGSVTHVNVQPAAGSGEGLCWAAAGGQALIPAGTTVPIPVTVANYSWLRPRKLNISSSDALLPESNPTRFLRVMEVTGVGRNVIGSLAGIAGASIDAYAQNALQFGRNVSSISAANAITVLVRNDGPNDILASADFEGWGQQ